MLLVIRGHHLPGRQVGPYHDVHVGLQVGGASVDLVPAHQDSVEWTTEIDVTGDDFRGPAVQGRKGDRFVYLTWGEHVADAFTMFGRAKLMLAGIPTDADVVTVSVDLTDDRGRPRCGRLRAPALQVG